MNIYKVFVENNIAISATIEDGLQHCDMGLNPVDKTLQWLAIACEDEQMAIEVTEAVIESIRKQEAGRKEWEIDSKFFPDLPHMKKMSS